MPCRCCGVGDGGNWRAGGWAVDEEAGGAAAVGGGLARGQAGAPHAMPVWVKGMTGVLTAAASLGVSWVGGG